MTNEQCAYLSVADDARFIELAKQYGMEVAGPSRHGSLLIRDTDGRAWLASKVRKTGLLSGRAIVESAWTPLNVAVMRGESTEGIEQ